MTGTKKLLTLRGITGAEENKILYRKARHTIPYSKLKTLIEAHSGHWRRSTEESGTCVGSSYAGQFPMLRRINTS